MMGKKSRVKRERREQAGFVAALTDCAGTWLEQPPQPDEQARLLAARQVLAGERARAAALTDDQTETNRRSLTVFRAPRFAPLYFDDWVIEKIIDRLGEPPVVEDDDDPAFSDYLRAAVELIATPQVRRALAEQSRRLIPLYVAERDTDAALLVEYNAYLTVMSDAITPLLVQMLVGGLARWYDEHEGDEDEPPADGGAAA